MSSDKHTGTDAQYQRDYSKPVAYDNDGRPLYAHPPATAIDPGAAQADHRYVHFSRAISPDAPDIPPEIMERHETSKRKYPYLNLSKGEYIISDLHRHWIGLAQIWLTAILLIAALMALVVTLLTGENGSEQMLLLATTGLALMSFFILGGAAIASYVYRSNRFFLTNESVIQEIQLSLFNKHEQTVSLSNIEDASFYQNGILPYIFNYGMIRLSTEGDETTYRFSYATNPKRQIAILNNAVESFKNGRPIEPDDAGRD